MCPIAGTTLPDPAPRHWGNDDIKKIILYALCVLEEDVFESVVPITLVAKSGEGKTNLITSLKETGLPAKIYSKDAVTKASLGMIKGDRVVSAHLSKIILFDETNKWNLDSLEGTVLPIFGKESSVRIRSGDEIVIITEPHLPIATILPQWEEFEGSGGSAARRIHTIEQILRRSVILRIEPTSINPMLSKEFVKKAFMEWFQNYSIRYKGRDYEEVEWDMLVKTLRRADRLKERLIEPKALHAAVKVVDDLRHSIVISERVHYAEQLPELVIRLAQGRALAYGRTRVSLHDFEEVRDILLDHAKRLGMYAEKGPSCPTCGATMANGPGPFGDEWNCSRFPHCRQTLKYSEGVKLRDDQAAVSEAKAKRIEREKREATEKAYASVDTRKDPTADDLDT